MADTEDITWSALLLPVILLGAIEGLSEFLPVSSTGHLILLVDLFKFRLPPGHVFEVAIQSGAILAVCVLYFRRLIGVAVGVRADPSARAFIRNIALTSIPAAALGLAFGDAVLGILFDPRVVAYTLLAGGVIMLMAERLPVQSKFGAVSAIPPRVAIAIGFAQSLALIPGVSRSAATIIGGLLLGVERRTAAEYSFFGAIPVLFGATALRLAETASELTWPDVLMLIAGALTAFVFATAAIRFLLAVVSSYGFTPFAIYRILLGSVLLFLVL